MSSPATEPEKSGNGGSKHRLSGRIHIVGSDNGALFIAHSLASRRSVPPITLLLNDFDSYQNWMDAKQSISLQANGLEDIKTGFDVNVRRGKDTWYSVPPETEQVEDRNDDTLESDGDFIGAAEPEARGTVQFQEDDSKIECVIIPVRSNWTVLAVESIKHRLTPDSTILILSDGLGTMEEINRHCYPDPETRPHFMQGVFTHYIRRRKRGFQFYHAQLGTLVLGVPPQDGRLSPAEADKIYWTQSWADSTRYLMRMLTTTAPLVATAAAPTDLLLTQLEQIAIQSVLQPLTALMGFTNGATLYNYHFTRVMRLLLLETCSIIAALPEVRAIPGMDVRFGPERIRRMITQVAERTAGQESNMLRDINANRITEIQFLNGYIVRRGEELGVKPVMNYLIQALIQGKTYEARQKEISAIPIDVPADGQKQDSRGARTSELDRRMLPPFDRSTK
ncbi:6-phosphogluconate dehydrogenase C-terminal domain-like protein [Aspergillus violaceofuscus CBS 115571]|uniref:6-phosphogluconate dehydrogenase C-terminal domain-like protein n=1 Tax=Aspergillus violaceofuscus (strain CBS 115571) TaxID=1450538 RepID=A0A2V5GZU7_ASPV1|nr:6-phosphogluconate dehydrogenase C-terminal domain-like protein [Aspergillus violaceofuscus CBS 115571]